jgi:hypothetical protein
LYVTFHVKNVAGDAYGGHQAAIAIIMSMVQGLARSSDILPAINRLVGIVGDRGGHYGAGLRRAARHTRASASIAGRRKRAGNNKLTGEAPRVSNLDWSWARTPPGAS